MMEKDYRDLCRYLALDAKKMMRKRWLVFLPFLSTAGLLVATNELILAFCLLTVGLMTYKFDYFTLKRRYHHKVINRQLEFTNFFSYLIIFLERKMNLFQALGASEDYLENDFHALVTDFREAINTSTSIEPYLQFSAHFASDAILEVLIILYQYERNGGSEVDLKNFSTSLQRLHDNEVDRYLKASLSGYDYFAFCPLIASAIVATAFALAILSNVGGLLNV